MIAVASPALKIPEILFRRIFGDVFYIQGRVKP
jgi:hypothetical protein